MLRPQCPKWLFTLAALMAKHFLSGPVGLENKFEIFHNFLKDGQNNQSTLLILKHLLMREKQKNPGAVIRGHLNLTKIGLKRSSTY
jgi:hypothetical protein